MFKPIFKDIDILVVDDEPDNLSIISELLTLLGSRVITAIDGQEALTQALKHVPDLIISDLSMPKVNGWDFLINLRQDETTKDIPVIALTAHAMAGDKERALAAGFVNYIAKPIDIFSIAPHLTEMLNAIPSIAPKMIEHQAE